MLYVFPIAILVLVSMCLRLTARMNRKFITVVIVMLVVITMIYVINMLYVILQVWSRIPNTIITIQANVYY